MKLFQMIDVNQNGEVTRSEFYDFMNKQFLNPQLNDADKIIQEFDSTMNQMMDFDEFCQLVLPSTNPSLRNIVLLRRNMPQFRTNAIIPYEVLSLFTRLLDKEMQL